MTALLEQKTCMRVVCRMRVYVCVCCMVVMHRVVHRVVHRILYGRYVSCVCVIRLL